MMVAEHLSFSYEERTLKWQRSTLTVSRRRCLWDADQIRAAATVHSQYHLISV